MSVYTTVTAEDLDAWLARYMVGGLTDLAPIASGIENTNYFVTTEKGRFVLVQREHETTFFRRHEIIGVFDSRRDRREIGQAADHVAGEPCVEILSGDGRVDGHEKYAAGTYLTGLRNRAENDQSASRLKMSRAGQAVLKRKQ